MPDLVGRCTLLQAAQGHCPHRCERRTAACGMRARRRGAVLLLVLHVASHHCRSSFVDTRGLMGCIDFGEPGGRAERCRARGIASACIPAAARTARPGYRPIRGSGRHPITPSSINVAGTSAGGSAETQRPWRRRGKSLAYRLSSCKRSLAGGALNSPYFLIPWPTHLCSAGPMSWLSCSSLLCAQVATRTLRAARTRACDGTEAAW